MGAGADDGVLSPTRLASGQQQQAVLHGQISPGREEHPMNAEEGAPLRSSEGGAGAEADPRLPFLEGENKQAESPPLDFGKVTGGMAGRRLSPVVGAAAGATAKPAAASTDGRRAAEQDDQQPPVPPQQKPRRRRRAAVVLSRAAVLDDSKPLSFAELGTAAAPARAVLTAPGARP